MEGSTETIVTPKKTRKTRSTSANEDVVENKTNYEPESVIPNGKGKTNGEESGEDESRPKTEVKSNKIIKISKSTKTSVKDTAKTTASPNKNKPDKRPEESSPSSSLLSEDFCGFEEFTESDEQLKNKRALQRLLDSLEDVEEKEKKTEDESEEEAMTAEDADAADSDSNQMEIDEGNSLADSVEFSDKNAKKVKDSDREVMETDSVKNVEGSPEKPEGDAKPAEEPTTELAAAESGDQLKVEYCGTCNLVVDDAEEGICCDGKCERWFHLQCSGLTQAEYDELSHDENAKWACNRCSGKPPPEIKPGAKPLLTVRKDLTAVSTPSPKRKITTKEDKRPRVDISNPIFLKPFDYGWKRELVFRSTSDSATKKQGDVYYYTPKGKKLRSLREIGEHLIGTDLSIDNFTFWKDALGCDPEKEIIRDAKIKLNKDKDSNASPVPTVKKPAPPKTPKTPKTTPKLTATVTPLDSASGLPVVAKVSASVTPRVVLKAGKTGSLNTGPKFKATPNKTNTPGQPNKIVINKEKKKKPDSDDDMEMGMLPPTWDPVQKPKENKTPVKRALEEAEGPPPAKQARLSSAPAPAPNMELLMSQACGMYDCLLQVFQYLKVQEVLRASRVCRMWRDLALHKSLWEVVRMKNSQVKDWEGFAATLRRTGTRHLDLRKMLMPDKQEALRAVWADCIKALSKVNTLVKLDMCRCTGGWLEQIIAVCPQIEYISAGAIKSSSLNLTSLKNCQNLTELRLKSLSGMEVNNIDVLENLTKLKNVSLTSVKNMTKVLEVVPKLTNLEVLELGEMTNLSNEAVTEAFSKLTKLRRLRLEKGGEGCPTDIILETISQLPSLVQLELINFDVKAGFDEALGRCTNIKVLLIIPTYVTQSATTNHLVIEGVSKLSKSLVHFVWGLTLELLRVTDLFIDQWEMNKNTGPKSPNQAPKKSAGDSIPILKPSTKDGKKVKEGAVTQVDVLQLPKLHKVLTTLLPNTRIIILKVPFSATWRQTISGSTQ
ncbi:uncharacterized protein LOC128988068 isoform X5 [Macrosteles quadrilineatus]|uniref:uncharacterized protein LOC128988068 isoform X5 n=1 Tax=Macrosteles quadrilineatus TaxID=74068 RepID=UPI0023E10DB0|nr:uncharacterized protein LOC128988068 isoform X5 [Macrosteles quadrilineatus]